ncbi:MAG: Fic family protein [Actinomycetota bacterium]|nr:Fic family protein [Actinomycetota bacterium]
MQQAIELADLLLITEAVLEIPAEDIQRVGRMPEAESALAAPYASIGGKDFYPDPAERAAILCSRIIRNHPLPDGNKRVGYLAMREALFREGLDWKDPAGGQNEIAGVIEAVAAREMGEPEFIDWVKARTA